MGRIPPAPCKGDVCNSTDYRITSSPDHRFISSSVRQITSSSVHQIISSPVPPITTSPIALISSIVRSMIFRASEEEIELGPIRVDPPGGFSMDAVRPPAMGSRRNEDIALDMMRFIAMTTGYGKTGSSGGAGFERGG